MLVSAHALGAGATPQAEAEIVRHGEVRKEGGLLIDAGDAEAMVIARVKNMRRESA